jgi:hypothetical protein
MDPKLLTENGWKAIVSKFKVKDNGLQRALAAYEKLDEDKFAERQKAVAVVSQFAGNLQKSDAVSGAPQVDKYLDDLADAAEAAKRQILQEKALAEKAAKASALAAKTESAEAKKQEQQEDKYEARLLAALQKLKSAPEGFEFIVCDAKPFCAVMVARAITTQHKTELTEMTDGSKRFLPIGTCRFENGKYMFGMERAPSGLARKIQQSIQHFTGKKFAVVLGHESAEEDEDT